MEIRNSLAARGLLAGVVVARNIEIRPSSAALAEVTATLLAERAGQDFPHPSLKEDVRGLLRTGGFKPSGRSKPASEYLAQAAREGRYPSINNLVDVNNYVSLATGLPISLLNADAFGAVLDFRFGAAGERYVFNGAGHEIDLEGLICACGDDQPLGNPVKDSMRGKVTDETRNVVGIIYAPQKGEGAEAVRKYLPVFADWIGREGGTDQVQAAVLP